MTPTPTRTAAFRRLILLLVLFALAVPTSSLAGSFRRAVIARA